MTYLEMVQKAIRWSGVRSTEPSTLVNSTGLVRNMADQVSAAWEELQLERDDWRWNTEQAATGIISKDNDRFFLRTTSVGASDSDNKISGIIDYDTDTGASSVSSASIADVQYYIKDCTVGINDDTSKHIPDDYLIQVDWDQWPYHEELATNSDKPKYYTFSPNGEMVVYPIADQDYRLFFITPRVPQVLEDDSDEITDIPEFMQKGVIFRGILYYGMYIQDVGMVEYARTRYTPYKKWLEKKEMDDVRLGDSGLY